MRVELFEFQKDTLVKLSKIVTSVRLMASTDSPQAVSFSAPTGSGKTIIITTLFEDIFYGTEDTLPQSDAVFLWISDIPELNEQTRLKIEGKSDKIKAKQLVTIDTTFDSEKLEGGRIYFINTQKLGSDKLLTKKGDSRQFSIWETFANTATSVKNFYVVIDEAHRGMKSEREGYKARTIIQKFLLGSIEDGMIIIPLVVGLSATPRRFEEILMGKPHSLHKVYVSPEEVRKSGLLKDRILIHYPEDSSNADMSLLATATERWNDLTKNWKSYCLKEKEKEVRPILVIQVEDTSGKMLTKTDLSTAINTIESTLGRKLKENEIRHTFNEQQEIEAGGKRIKRIDASRIEENEQVNVVLFKMSLSTGWDCPRAEIMMSFRRAVDHTYIAQLLGRMVRSPLARRIQTNPSLNDVHLFLPRYDKEAVETVIADLRNGEDIPPTDTGTSKELITLKIRPSFEDLFAILTDHITYRVNAVRKQSTLRRVMGLARALTIDGIDKDSLEATTKAITNQMEAELAIIRAKSDYKTRKAKIIGIAVNTLILENINIEAKPDMLYGIEVALADIETLFNQTAVKFGNSLNIAYWKEHSEKEVSETKIDVIILAADEKAMASLEAYAQKLFDELFKSQKKAIAKLTENRRNHYDMLLLSSNKPEAIPWVLPNLITYRVSDKSIEFDKHLYVNERGKFRTELNSWESGVLYEELADAETIAWLRNIPNKSWSLEIPYPESGIHKPMFPDLVVFKKSGKDFEVDILEPHDPSRGDNYKKAIGLAQFADKHWELFGRIELIRKKKGKDRQEHFYRLDMISNHIRKQVMNITNNDQLDNIFEVEAMMKEKQ